MVTGTNDLRCAFESKGRTQSASGSAVIGWAPEFERWVSISFQSRRQRLDRVEAGAETGDTLATLTFRDDPDTRRIRTDWRAVMKDRQGYTTTWVMLSHPVSLAKKPGYLEITIKEEPRG